MSFVHTTFFPASHSPSAFASSSSSSVPVCIPVLTINVRNLTFVILLCVALSETTWRPEFGAQLHSINDMRAWPQALDKVPISPSGRFLKIDPQWLPPSLCALQERANHSDPRGCFVFNHDTVTVAARRTMNTSEDLITWLADPRSAIFTTDHTARLAISLCFKGCGGAKCPCDNAPATKSWLSFVDELMADLASVIATHQLNVTILLDGNGNPGASPCLAQRWRPVDSVFISGNDPVASFTSDNATLGWDRLVVLNEPLSEWPTAAAARFGKFSNPASPASQWPWVVWEPSDQAGMASIASTYEDALGPNASHDPGMLWAINTDPAQWAVYTAPSGSAAISRSLCENQQTCNASTPRIASTPAPVNVSATVLLLVTWMEEERGLVYSVIATNSTRLGNENGAVIVGSGVVPAPSFDLGTPAPFVSLVRLDNGSALALFDGPSGTQVYLLFVAPTMNVHERTQPVVTLERTSSYPSRVPSPANPTVFAATYAACNTTLHSLADLCRIVLVSGNGSCVLEATVITHAFASPSQSRGPSSSTTCVVVQSTPPLPPLDGMGPTLAAAPYTLPDEPSDQRLAIVVSFAAGGSTYGATLCTVPSGVGVLVNDPVGCWGAPPAIPGLKPASAWPFPPGSTAPLPSLIGSGGGIAVSPVPRGAGSPALLVVTGDSTCLNSEARNKDAVVGLCDAPPIRVANGTQYVAFTTGTVEAWALQLVGADAWWRNGTSGSGPRGGGASICSLLTASGMAGMGGSPSPTLWQSPDGFGVEGAVVWTGARGDGSSVGGVDVTRPRGRSMVSVPPDPNVCGAAVAADGDILLNAWFLPQRYFGL